MKKGYQTMHINDVYHIEEMLQKHDPYLYIAYNPNDGTHLIMDGLMDTAIMKIPQIGFEKLDMRAYREIRRISPERGYSVTKELNESENRRARESEKTIDEIASEMAKDSKRAFINAFDYGITDGAQKYHKGGIACPT